MTLSNNDLDRELQQINERAEEVRQLTRRTNEETYRFYAEAYLWWHEAIKNEGYLEDCYKKNSIRYQNKGNRINWIPFIKLVTNGNIAHPDSSYWARAFETIHEEYTENTKNYEHDTIAKIAYFIKNNRGKTGLAQYHAESDELDDDVDEIAEIKKIDMLLDEKYFEPAFVIEADDFFKNKSSKYITNIPPLFFDRDGYGLILVKKGEKGIEFVASSNSNSDIKSTKINSYRKQFSVLPNALRVVLETMHIMNVPNNIAGNIDKFIEYNYITQDYGTEKIKEKRIYRKKLIYRPETNDFLYSLRERNSSVIVNAKPNTRIVDRQTGDIQLRHNIVRYIDVALLHKTMFNMFDADYLLEEMCYSGIVEYSIGLRAKESIVQYVAETPELMDSIRKQVENLKNINIAFIPVYSQHKTTHQPDINFDTLNPQWKSNITIEQLRILTGEFFDRWVVEYGNKTTRTMNKFVSIQFRDNNITFNYEYDGIKNFSVSKSIKTNESNKGINFNILTRSCDVMFVFRQIADLEIISTIDIEALPDAILLQFSTDVADYKTLIPACDTQENRKSACIKAYKPKTVDFIPDYEQFEDMVQYDD